jgi:cytosine/adenosine deaminase-related metal-dependent hydrolase
MYFALENCLFLTSNSNHPMRKISADYLYCGGNTLIKNGVIIVDNDGKILDVVNPERENDFSELTDVERYDGLLCPGFVNTHCHLELSNFRDLIPQNEGLDGFIRSIEWVKKNVFSHQEIAQSITDADLEMWNNGVVAVGDICNTSLSLQTKKESKLSYYNFVEVFSSNALYASNQFSKAKKLVAEFENADLKSTITPHSLYALSEPLLSMIVDYQTKKNEILSLHFMESQEEVDFFTTRKGLIMERAKSFGVNPLQYEYLLDRPSVIAVNGLNNELPNLFVHNTVANHDDISLILNSFQNPWFCLCPNSNLYIENRLPDIYSLHQKKAQITIGTDSLASNNGLSILAELKTIANSFPKIPTAILLQWATENGAKFLKMDDKFGTISAGKTPGINLILCKNGNLATASGVQKLL